MSIFSTTSVGAGDVASLFALVRTFAPETAPQDWAAAAATQLAAGGILGLRGAGGDFLGMAAWRVATAPDGARELCIDSFVTIEINAAAPGRRCLAEALATLGAERGCTRLRQVIGCRPDAPAGLAALHNHLTLPIAPGERAASRGPGCACGPAHSGSAAELYPAP